MFTKRTRSKPINYSRRLLMGLALCTLGILPSHGLGAGAAAEGSDQQDPDRPVRSGRPCAGPRLVQGGRPGRQYRCGGGGRCGHSGPDWRQARHHLFIAGHRIASKTQGFDIVILSNHNNAQASSPDAAGILVRTDGPKSLKELEGKRVLVNNLQNVNWAYTREAIARAGGNPDKVQFLEVGFPLMVDSLLGGQADAASTTEPFTTIGVGTGKLRVLSYMFTELQPNLNIAGWLSTTRLGQGASQGGGGIPECPPEGDGLPRPEPGGEDECDPQVHASEARSRVAHRARQMDHQDRSGRSAEAAQCLRETRHDRQILRRKTHDRAMSGGRSTT